MFEINKRKIGCKFQPYIIAELSANHNGSIERAKDAIKAAKHAGASAVKIQTYTPDTMTINSYKSDFFIQDGPWKGRQLYELYKEAFTPFEWHEELFRYAANIGITLFSTPFDESAVDLLESLGTPAYKIASFELTDLPLIGYIAKKNKPILMSTGMGSLNEIREAVEVVKKFGNEQLLLFHCVSSYPAPTQQSRLSNIKLLSKEFDVEVGLSDHSISNIASTVAIALGAVAIEKHFKLNERSLGPDSNFSLVPDQFSALVKDCKQAWLAIGPQEFSRAEVEKNNMKFRRSLYFVKNLMKGSTVTKYDVRRIRPGHGLAPKFYDEIIGKTLKENVEIGDPVTWSCF